MFSGSPLFILTLTCLTKDAENVSKMLKPRLEKVPAAPITEHAQSSVVEYFSSFQQNSLKVFQDIYFYQAMNMMPQKPIIY